MKRTDFLKASAGFAVSMFLSPLMGKSAAVQPDYIVSADGKEWIFTGEVKDKRFEIPSGVSVVFTGSYYVYGCKFIYKESAPNSFATFRKASGTIENCYFNCSGRAKYAYVICP